MTTQYQPLHARERVPLLTLARLLRTALLLQVHGGKAMAGIPHEPFPDRILPGVCNIEWLSFDAPVHQRKRKAPRDGDGLGPERAGWR